MIEAHGLSKAYGRGVEIMELVGAPYTFIRGPFVNGSATRRHRDADGAVRPGADSLDLRRAALLVVGALLVDALAGALASHPSRWKGRFAGPRV